ncbi:low-density lipoprotein receptor-related protein 6 [Lingula anatina]|uniref:Low-density lipoprotein receptor-related protein 6 n=1 Tax=Lingula anatina TaxID=7574 RepID=A0A1S3JKI6_LINAN|nr:low-density lipoprotein receptor-related protein 6 [Lingula anatina]|eukprot:XP_013410893.1 low-density lipoprotein receptor-related protein 6 [Lingula anatina]
MRWIGLISILSSVFNIIHGEPRLIFANRKDVRMVDAENPHANATIIVSGLEDAAALDFYYDATTPIIFWTDVSLEVIMKTYLFPNGTKNAIKVVSTGLIAPDGLACDWLGKKLYWTDSETNRIEVSDFNGNFRKVLFWQNLDQPRAIALDPLNGNMFWTDWGETPKIEKAGMDGKPETRSTIIKDNIFWPNGLTIDYDEQKIYWADAKLSFIHSCNYDGSDRQQIVHGDLPHPFALTVTDQMLFWTDWKSRAIHYSNKITGSQRMTVHEGIYSPMDIHAFSQSRQKPGISPCGTRNGGCSHLCLISPLYPFYSCACPTGVRLLPDGHNCSDGAQQILLLARRADLRRISLDTPDYTDVVLQFDNIIHAIAVDFDPVGEYVYWTDDEVKAIRRAYLNGTEQEDVINQEIDNPDGVAVDWIAGNLYWTDTGTDRIEVARLNGTSRKVLITENLQEPRAIALDPQAGYMYWTDWGTFPKIERANLDGSDRVIMFNTSLGWPNGLALSAKEKKIYWCDAKTDKIEVANMDGTGRRVLVSERLPHIFGFSLLDDHIYWTDWQRRSIERINRHTGGNRTTIVDMLPDLMGLKAVDVKRIEGTNPCADSNDGCSHLCLFRPPPKGPICACPMGLELMADKKTCIVPEAFLLFTRRADIRRISLETNHNEVVVIPINGVKEASALDFDINDNRIYWTDIGLRKLSRAFMNGSALEHIVEFGLMFPEGMSVDWVAKNVYWADTGTNRIEVARLDGTSRKVLVWNNLDSPRALALDPANSHMYWTEWSSEPKIECAAMDGTYRRTLIKTDGRVNSLTIDYAQNRLYWVDVDSFIIESSDLEGGYKRQIITNGLNHPMGLTMYDDFLYWTDWNTKTIERANKTNGLNRTVIRERMDFKIMDILVFHASRQSGWNQCGVNNGGCDQLCLAHPKEDNSPYTHHCACPTHYRLNSDNKTCSPPESFLLFSTRNSISRMVTDSSEDSPDIVLPLHGLRNVKAVSFDPVERVIYWIDGRSKAIRRAYENGSNVETVSNQEETSSPFDLAIDPYTHHIYWTCSQNNVIRVTRVDRSDVGVIIQGNNDKPRTIVLNPERGWLFWTNMGSSPKIERASMDGTKRMILFSNNLGKPEGLAIDNKAGRLYWSDTKLQRIECAEITGLQRSRRVLVETGIKDPISVAVHGNYLYWVDKGLDLIERINKYSGADRKRIQGRIENLSDLKSVEKITPKDFNLNPCSVNNGGCSHICVARKDSTSVCNCPLGLILDPQKDQICTPPPTCDPNQFTCLTGNIDCVPKPWQCDGYVECQDGSDEKDCNPPTCKDDEFACKSGNKQCIPLDQKCNGKSDCDDHSDERETCCVVDQIYCEKEKKCIPSSYRCDGKKDCKDGSDERNCTIQESPIKPSTAQYTVGIVVGLIAVMLVLVIIVIACKRKSSQTVTEDTSRDIIFVAKTQTPTIGQSTPPNTLSSRGKSGTTCLSVTTDASRNSGGPPYDRTPLTGASSSSSSVTHYPLETLNPPPSPVTDRSVCGVGGYSVCSGSNSPSTVRSYRQYNRLRNIPPLHTTPCSTDVCEESEPYPPTSRRYYPSLLSSELNYDSDPYPPPPTPRSHYFSDAEPSYPPSPSTERSFFVNPYPPPPSPTEATSDC